MAAGGEDQEFEAGLRALEASTRAECPACGQAAGFTSDLVPYSLVPMEEATEPANHGKPLLAFVCRNCGFVRLHHTQSLRPG